MSAAPAAPAATPPGAGRVRAALTGDGRARFGVAVIALLVFAAAAAPLVARHDPTAIDLGGALARQSAAHWLGTDVQGRDVWARLVHGARVSLLVGVASQVIALTLGVALGLVAGYTAQLERFVRRAPEQYFWHHRRWKRQPPDTPPELRDPSAR